MLGLFRSSSWRRLRPPTRSAYSDWSSPPTIEGFLRTDPDMQQLSAEPAPLSASAYGKHDPIAMAPAHRLHCHSTRTNTINTFTDPDGAVIAWFSGGSCGFRKRNRSTYEAGYQCAIRMFDKIKATAENQPGRPLTVDLFLKGFGQGREALLKALATAQGNDVRPRIVSLTDRTPIKIGGTRAKKRKRR